MIIRSASVNPLYEDAEISILVAYLTVGSAAAVPIRRTVCRPHVQSRWSLRGLALAMQFDVWVFEGVNRSEL